MPRLVCIDLLISLPPPKKKKKKNVFFLSFFLGQGGGGANCFVFFIQKLFLNQEKVFGTYLEYFWDPETIIGGTKMLAPKNRLSTNILEPKKTTI